MMNNRSLRPWSLFSLALLFAIPASLAQSAEHWIDSRQVGPFVARANFSLDKLEPLFAHLNVLQNDLVNQLGIAPAEEKIELLLFRDEWTYRSYLRRHFPNRAYRRALFVKQQGQSTVLVHWSHDFLIDARHECTHALLHASLPMVPLWLDEGLAEYYEMPPAARAYGHPHARSLRWHLFWGDVAGLGRLEKLVDFEKMDAIDYRDCWAWVHFMLHGSSTAHAELVRYLDDIGRDKDPGLLSVRLAGKMSRPAVHCSMHHRRWRLK